MQNIPVKVIGSWFLFSKNNWRGKLVLADSGIEIKSDDGAQHISFSFDSVKKANLNGNNGFWVVVMQDKTKYRFQTGGALLKATKDTDYAIVNEAIIGKFKKFNIPFWSV